MNDFGLKRNHRSDTAGVPDTALILKALKAEAFIDLLDGTGTEIELMDGIHHFGIVLDESAITRFNTWLSGQ